MSGQLGQGMMEQSLNRPFIAQKRGKTAWVRGWKKEDHQRSLNTKHNRTHRNNYAVSAGWRKTEESNRHQCVSNSNSTDEQANQTL